MEVDHATSSSGHNPKLFNDQQAIKKYICAICNNVLKDAVQIPQSADPRRACHDCYNNNIRYVCIQFCSWKCSQSKVFADINWFENLQKFCIGVIKRSCNRHVSWLPLSLKNRFKGCSYGDEQARVGGISLILPGSHLGEIKIFHMNTRK